MSAETPTVAPAVPAVHGPATRRERAAFAWVAAVVLIAVLAGIVWWAIGRDTRLAAEGVPVVAVMPLNTSSADPRDATLGLGVGDALVSDLAGYSRHRSGAGTRRFRVAGAGHRRARYGARARRGVRGRRRSAGGRRPGADQRARHATGRHGCPRRRGTGAEGRFCCVFSGAPRLRSSTCSPSASARASGRASPASRPPVSKRCGPIPKRARSSSGRTGKATSHERSHCSNAPSPPIRDSRSGTPP